MLPNAKIRIADNQLLSDAEYDLCCRLCDIIGAVAKSSPASATPTGIFWPRIGTSPPHRQFLDKNRRAIDHSLLLRTCYRDFPTIAYEDDAVIPAPDYLVRRYMRLCAGVPERWRLRIPARFGEIGWNIDGFPVNRHTAFLQERVNCLSLLGVLPRLDRLPHPVIVEIGAGAGELGYFFRRALPHCTWVDCDLPESLVQSAAHLAILVPDSRHFVYVGSIPLPSGIDESLVLRSPAAVAAARGAVISVPHFLFAELRRDLRIDLAFNAWSFGEMSGDTVRDYVAILADMCADRGFIAEQNGDHTAINGCDPKPLIAERFPFRREASFYLTKTPSGIDVVLWSASQSRLDEVLLSSAERDVVARSFDDREDRPDLDIPVECWHDLAVRNLE